MIGKLYAPHESDTQKSKDFPYMQKIALLGDRDFEVYSNRSNLIFRILFFLGCMLSIALLVSIVMKLEHYK